MDMVKDRRRAMRLCWGWLAIFVLAPPILTAAGMALYRATGWAPPGVWFDYAPDGLSLCLVAFLGLLANWPVLILAMRVARPAEVSPVRRTRRTLGALGFMLLPSVGFFILNPQLVHQVSDSFGAGFLTFVMVILTPILSLIGWLIAS